jgi:hypothetical protein
MAKVDPRRERFRRLASLRTNAVLKRLKVLGNCANRQAYEYTEEEIDKIFATIQEQVKAVRARFQFPKEKEFKL